MQNNSLWLYKAGYGKKFSPLSNAIFSLGLTAGELTIYAYLMYCEDRKSHQCWPSYKAIGKAVGMSRNTVQKYVRELEYKASLLRSLRSMNQRADRFEMAI